MADPIAVFDSETHPGDRVFMLEVKDRNGSTVVVPVAIGAKKSKKSRAKNVAKTTYAKDYDIYIQNEDGGLGGKTSLPRNEWFIEQMKKMPVI